jgi:hypothetical protein
MGMAVVSLSFVVTVLFVMVDLVFIVKPVRRFGLLNLVLGLFTVLFSIYFGLVADVGDLTVVMRWWFAAFVALVGVLCLWRGLSVGGLSE